jgi:NtrC-family two-component system sensor histidine kinase KinB
VSRRLLTPSALSWPPLGWAAPARYALAAVVIGSATLLQFALRSMLPQPETLFFYPAVLAATWLTGFGPGIAATIAAALAMAYFFLPPEFSIAIGSPRDQLDLTIFAALSTMLVAGLERLRASIAARTAAQHAAEDASRRLEQERALLDSVLQNVPIGLAFATPDAVVRLKNQALRTIAERDRGLENLEDVAARHRLRAKDGHIVSADEWSALLRDAERGVVDSEAEWHTESDRPVWVHTLLAPVRAPDQRRLGTVAILRDVSAEHSLAQLRDEFAAVIAHDLRGPISSILLPVEQTLRQKNGDGDAEFVRMPTHLLERMRRGAQRLTDLVADLLEASRVEMGRMVLNRQGEDLSRFVTELVDEVRPTLRDHPVAVEVPPQPVVASFDRARLGRVVSNLLDNASKYSRPNSTIRVALRRNDGGAEFAVADEGGGIAPDDVPRLFDRFFQAQRARTQKEGLGLGLYIAKGIVDAHGGKLSVESAPGIGSTFRIWLPLASPVPGDA